MTDLKPSSRRASKLLTAWCLAGIYFLAFYGITVGYQSLPELLTVVGSVSVAMVLLYMYVGHKDLLAFIGSGLFDLRGKGKPHD